MGSDVIELYKARKYEINVQHLWIVPLKGLFEHRWGRNQHMVTVFEPMAVMFRVYDQHQV